MYCTMNEGPMARLKITIIPRRPFPSLYLYKQTMDRRTVLLVMMQQRGIDR